MPFILKWLTVVRNKTLKTWRISSESDEKHSKTIEEIRERKLKAMKELKMMITGIAQQTTEVATQVQHLSCNGGMGILGSGNGVNGQNHYTKLEFPHFDGLNPNE